MSQEAAQPCLALTPAQQEAAARFVAQHGAEAFDMLLRGGAMMSDIRGDSKWALKSALGAYEESIPVVVMTRIHRNAKRSGERVEMRLVSGNAQLAVDFPAL